MFDNTDFEMALSENVLQEDLGVLLDVQNFEYNVDAWKKRGNPHSIS